MLGLNLEEIILRGKKLRASDIHITSDFPIMVRVDGNLVSLKDFPIPTEQDIKNTVEQLFSDLGISHGKKEIDFSFSMHDLRIRANYYFERKKPTLALRLITKKIRTIDELGLPQILKEFAEKDHGLILVAGPTGSGKSTTLAAMVEHINSRFASHIITIEDPIEYVFESKRSLIHQREVGTDTESFYNGLKYALRQDPDVILVGEMRDLETISLTLTAAETGHLVFATIHTNSAAAAPERIIDVFPAYQQKQIALQLANTLIAVIFQRLVPKKDFGVLAIDEIMIATSAIKNLIRENKLHQIEGIMQTSQKQGNILFDDALINAYLNGYITKETVFENARNVEEVSKKIGWRTLR
ncbi:twitching motility protein [Thermosipho melanesiensis]|uniref:Twitching motility protein n=2 Tax=Thermosipho melanesiensis TaxID=46541 RepID=A6LMU2_THEM4|nr:type IV pilus twitching motility protein PilT [Thermosipho melanesiensis]ABR31243.1 twitching motility protein [Thermosipho melanesiensis BI429]APT74327.1 twitching motility protein [Thermosipho melanesiensis]OOC36267.1 twitching motility protein [Thermosipho melanesiensis]OOC37085.1 twitching motility protein [Thermosipho melanesiensis]OOC37837.1 twitching motility protein [Thermosipho melanesiensis]